MNNVLCLTLLIGSFFCFHIPTCAQINFKTMQPKYKVAKKQQAETKQDKTRISNDKQSLSPSGSSSSLTNKVNLDNATTGSSSTDCVPPSTSTYFSIGNMIQALSNYLFGEEEEKVIHAAN